ncbi:rod shape-determining protein MreD [uncultured Thiodictyon sp.]|uniref:rod shape-determining protein MreD n=1 Tax=uncultured Thiodictyon sp. TaxID=1846217 RepID=UPI0025DF9BF7|nr:rod shape-determining protein MreD [uncultured Thiodictyon sp.]
MSEAVRRGTWAVWSSLLIALFLTILPMPAWMDDFRPPWVVLTLIFWSLALPERVGVFSAFAAGLTLDVTTGALLGHHALGFSVVAYLAVELHQRVRTFPLWQQTLFVWLLLLVERLLYLWVLGAAGQPTPSLIYWVPTFLGAALWPWVFVVLRDLARRAGAL